ncbi:hypothetical protein PYCH_12870 [Pyrococcus yayanosii CH1]|uniref:Uncharacterized protein n=2 Tax=Pyrococcus TaxID=2260 RepID=F8AFC5_PYRYC|nr:hypothetical protein PYCH_12870 [Pyrococcus yayanosii CH1]
MREFFNYLSEYTWKTMKRMSYEGIKELLIDFAKKEGIDLEKIAKMKGIDLDFNTATELTKVILGEELKSLVSPLYISDPPTWTIDNIYDYYGNKITNKRRDPATLYFRSGYFVGTYASAILYDGTVYTFIWTTYRDRFSVKDWILSYLAREYGITASEIEKIHVKYFIQGYADWIRRDQTTVYFDNSPVESGYIKFELWSEATYYPSIDSWPSDEIHSYPDDQDGGLYKIIGQKIKVLAGFPFYSQYPWLSSRSFGGGSETGISLTLYSNIYHQERLEGVGEWG